MSDLTGVLVKEIRMSLLDAFTSDEMKRLIREHLDSDMETITSSKKNIDAQYSDLIAWAEQRGKIKALLQGAIADRPDKRQVFEDILDKISSSATQHKAPPVFWQISGTQDVCIGREAELERIDKYLREGNGIVGLFGLGGIGKTQIAIEFARKFGDRYPGGVIGFDGQHSFTMQLSQMGKQIGKLDQDSTESEWIEEAEQHLQKKEALLIIDNVQDLKFLDQSIFPTYNAPLPSMRAKCKTLFTTREWDVPDRVASIKVEKLSEHTSLLMLLNETNLSIDLNDPKYACALEVCELLGHTPLNLKLVSAFLRNNPDVSLEDYRAGFGEHFKLQEAIIRVLSDHWERINKDGENQTACLALKLIAFLAYKNSKPIPYSHLRIILGRSKMVDLGDLFQPLITTGLIEQINEIDLVDQVDNYIDIHDRIQEYFYMQHELNEEERESLVRNTQQFYKTFQNSLERVLMISSVTGSSQLLNDFLAGKYLAIPESDEAAFFCDLHQIFSCEVSLLSYHGNTKEITDILPFRAYFAQQVYNQEIRLGTSIYREEALNLLSCEINSYLKLEWFQTKSGLSNIDGEVAHNARIITTTFLSSKKLVLSASRDGVIKLWDIENREIRFEPKLQFESNLAILTVSSDGYVAGGLEDGSIFVANPYLKEDNLLFLPI